MNTNQELILRFYEAFENHDSQKMIACYHKSVVFEDPVFGIQKGENIFDMWKMLLEKSNGNIKIEVFDIVANEYSGSAKWIATYNFSKTNRKVINHIYADFEFRDGLIVKHTDHFDVWKWSKQALGLSGFLFGWTGFMHKKIQENALFSLKKYQQQKN